MENSQTIINLLAVGLIGILIMILIARRKQYSKWTRTIMDLLIGITISAFLLVLMMIIAS
ncbi:hypothetical protein CWM47_20870 [Spirosoma pollinicola]|uniref:Uncharacterized protein n=1 Tax=Spirosoma pollinicola TaxID=2057025 RepID=A0A2K8Z2F4_9BACT|nr:hypothetical protein CWM47_20870 [Spirosoma pollinicola]